MLDADACYAAVARRDPAADGMFFTAVRTTGIYCRPICPARLPLRRNVTFYVSAAAAQAAGYRPCLRCRPESAPQSPAWIGSLAPINRALRLIDEGALVEGDVEALAERVGMTARHLRRLFQQHVGAGPVAVEQARRAHLALKLIHETDMPFTDIAFAAGYGSIRRFNETLRGLYGRPPSALRRRPRPQGAGLTVTVAVPRDAAPAMLEPLKLDWVAPGARVELKRLLPDTIEARIVGVPLRQIGRAMAWTRRVLSAGEGSRELSLG